MKNPLLNNNMGNIVSINHRCFNEYNTRFLKRSSNYYLPTHECKSGLDASWLREYPKGSFVYVCEDCYYEHYDDDRDDPQLSRGPYAPKPNDIGLSYNKDECEWSSKMPIPEVNRDLIDGEWPESVKMERPEWIEFPSGVRMNE